MVVVHLKRKIVVMYLGHLHLSNKQTIICSNTAEPELQCCSITIIYHYLGEMLTI